VLNVLFTKLKIFKKIYSKRAINKKKTNKETQN